MKRQWMLAGSACAILLMSASVLKASIRLDGSQIQASSSISRPQTTAKSAAPSPVHAIAFTFGQPVIAKGSLDNGDSSLAFKIGLGYEYNFLWTSIVCSCPCVADPECDGALNVLDVIKVIDVVFRNEPELKDANCSIANTDINCSGMSDMTDVISLIEVTFRSGDVATLICKACSN